MDASSSQPEPNNQAPQPSQISQSPNNPIFNKPPQSVPSKKNNKLLIGTIVLVITFAITAVALFVVKSVLSNDQNGTPTHQNTNPTPLQSQQSAQKLTKATEGVTTVEVTHPTTWLVTQNTNESGAISITITSTLGNILVFRGKPEVGGACTADNYAFTLTQKIPTATPNLFFSEYTTTSPEFLETGLSIDTSKFDIANKQVGDTGKDVCSNKIGYYPIVGKLDDPDSKIYVSVTSPKANQRNTRFSDISDDTEFIAMLQSLNVVVSE